MTRPSMSLVLEYQDMSFKELFNIISQCEHTSVTKMNQLAIFAVEKAQVQKHLLNEVQALYYLGKSQLRLGKLIEAQQTLQEALKKSGLLNYPSVEIDILTGLGTIQLYLHIYDQAYSFYQQALDLAIEQMDNFAQGKIYNNLGELYREHHEFEIALSYYQKSIDLFSDSMPKATQYSNFCTVAIDREQYDQALEFASTTLKFARAEGNRMIESVIMKYLGMIYRYKKNRTKSMEYFHQSLDLYQLTNEVIHMSEVYVEMHKLAMDYEDIDRALSFLHLALDYAIKVDSDMLLATIYGHYAVVYAVKKDYEIAFHYKQLEHQHRQNINDLERNLRLRSISTMDQMLKTHKEKEELALLTQQYREKSQLLEEAIYSLSRLSEVGKTITSILDLESVYDVIYDQVKDLIPNDFFGIGLVNETTNMFEYKYMIEDGKRVFGVEIPLDSTTSFAVASFKRKEEILVNSKDTYKEFVQYRTSSFGSPMNALMFVPLELQEKTIGVLSAQTRVEGVYNLQTLSTLKTLASYLAIAILNAQTSESLRKEVNQRKDTQEKLEEMNEALDQLSKKDPLTELANRRYFDDVAQMIVYNAQRLHMSVSLLMIDVDHFKEFNDEFGHLYGDAMIKLVAKIIESTVLRSSDVVARFGGDEFIVLLSDTEQAGAYAVATKIVEKLQETTRKYEQEVTLSIGLVTMVPEYGVDIEQLIEYADKALYQAKQEGRNQIVVYKEKVA